MNEKRDELIKRATAEAWHEFRYPRPAVDEPSEAFKRAIRAAADVLTPR